MTVQDIVDFINGIPPEDYSKKVVISYGKGMPDPSTSYIDIILGVLTDEESQIVCGNTDYRLLIAQRPS